MKLTPAQLALKARVAEAHTTEVNARTTLRLELEKELERLTTQATTATDSAIRDAYSAGVPKKQIAEALGTSFTGKVYERLERTEHLAGMQAAQAAALEANPITATLNADDNTVTVTVTNYQRGDETVNATVTYPINATNKPDPRNATGADALTAMKLLNIPGVYSAIATATANES